MNSEGSWGSPEADFRGNIDTLGIATFVAAKICLLDSYRVPDHGIAPDLAPSTSLFPFQILTHASGTNAAWIKLQMIALSTALDQQALILTVSYLTGIQRCKPVRRPSGSR